MWESEPIPDDALLFLRVHRQWIKNNEPRLGAFQKRLDVTRNRLGMSTDWNKYRHPEETRTKLGKDPTDYAVLQMSAGSIRADLPSDTIEHTPKEEEGNQGHTDIWGEDDEETRLKYSRLNWSWAISLLS
jgi:hypothetical protein